MKVILIMFLGILIGNKFVPDKYKGHNERLQQLCVIILIFLMGVSLGKQDGFLQELWQLGISSAILAIIPILFSLILVFYLTKKLFKE